MKNNHDPSFLDFTSLLKFHFFSMCVKQIYHIYLFYLFIPCFLLADTIYTEMKEITLHTYKWMSTKRIYMGLIRKSKSKIKNE